jgi:hypothetical protein
LQSAGSVDIEPGNQRGPARVGSEELQAATLESQLLGEIIALRQSARAESDPEARTHLLAQARTREVQLLVLLERSGRPLAARAMAESIQKI